MTDAQLQAVFKRHGLEVVNPINEKFNPNFHEALFQQVSILLYIQTIVTISNFINLTGC